jgi:hypothetical protein
MPTNDFLPYGTDPAANVISQATWAAGNLSQGQTRAVGFIGSTVAESPEANKLFRQSQFIAAAIAQYIYQTLNTDVLDNGDLAGFVNLLIQAVYQTAGRTKIVTPSYDIYVTPGGNDNNSGTSAAPFLTLQRAWNHLANEVDLDGNTATVHIAAGNYGPFTAFGQIMGATGPSSVNFIGDTVTPDNVIITAFDNNCVTVAAAQLTLKGVAVTSSGSTGTSGVGIIGIYGSTILNFDRIDFGSCSNAHWGATYGAFVSPFAAGSCAISGPANDHVYAIFGGVAQFDQMTIDISGNPDFPNGFANVASSGCVRSFGCNFSGPAQGPRYSVNTGGQIITSGAGPTYFPGSVAGTADATTFGSYS